MSTERRQVAKQEREIAAFETRDFYLACFLRCSGYELQGLRSEGPRKVFVFRDRASRRDDVMAFYGDATSCKSRSNNPSQKRPICSVAPD